jgi:Ca2+-binding EF-hand superfamily protein
MDDLHNPHVKTFRQNVAASKRASVHSSLQRMIAKRVASKYVPYEGNAQMLDDSSVLSQFLFLLRLFFGRLQARIVGLFVIIDFCIRILDIDARANGNKSETWARKLLFVCLSVYCLDFVAAISQKRRNILETKYSLLLSCFITLTAIAEIVLLAWNFSFQSLGLEFLHIARLLKTFDVLCMCTNAKLLVKLRKLGHMALGCMSNLFWSAIFLFIATTLWSMLAVELVSPLMGAIADQGFWDGCALCRDSISTVMKANLLLYTSIMAGDSWGQIPRPVILEHPWTFIIWVGSSFVLQFGVCNMIVALIVDSFAEDRMRNVEALAQEMKWQSEEDRQFLQSVFVTLDSDGSKSLSYEELLHGARTHPQFHSRLRVMDIDEQDLQELFDLLDYDRSGEVDPEEFVGALSRWLTDPKTATRFIKSQMSVVMQKQSKLEKLFHDKFEELELTLKLFDPHHQAGKGKWTEAQPTEGYDLQHKLKGDSHESLSANAMFPLISEQCTDYFPDLKKVSDQFQVFIVEQRQIWSELSVLQQHLTNLFTEPFPPLQVNSKIYDNCIVDDRIGTTAVDNQPPSYPSPDSSLVNRNGTTFRAGAMPPMSIDPVERSPSRQCHNAE